MSLCRRLEGKKLKMKNQKLKIKNIHMVDISQKPDTKRIAIAQAKVFLKPSTLDKLLKNRLPKGDALACAKVAGILAAKKVHELIPLCHPLQITSVDINFEVDKKKPFITIKSCVSSIGKTGVEMEALTAVSIAALTIYDMCKSVDRTITISDIKLLEKRGGKSGGWKNIINQYKR